MRKGFRPNIRGQRGNGVIALLFTTVLAVGCTAEAPGDRPPELTTEPEETLPSSPVVDQTDAPPELERVDPEVFAQSGYPGTYAWKYSTGDNANGICVVSKAVVTCNGTAKPDIPDLTMMFPGPPGAIEVGAAGLRYTFIEGVPSVPGTLETGQVVEIGAVRCAKPSHDSLECRSAGGEFTVSGSERIITTSGTVLPERDYSNHPESGSDDDTPAPEPPVRNADQPTEYMGTSGLVSGVRTASGQLVTASVPPCDGRGILIHDSYVETASAQQDIAGLLDAHQGAEFATPGHCESLRSELDGARVYPIYTDHGHDLATLCSAKASRGGNARLLTNAADYSDPC